MKRLRLPLLTTALLLPALAAQAGPAQNPAGSTGAGAKVSNYQSGGLGQVSAASNYGNGNVLGDASASLLDGSLHALAWSSNNPTLPSGCKPDMLACNWGIGADAWMWEQLTLKAGPGFKPGEVVSWTWAVDGSTTRGKWWSGARAESWFYSGLDPNGWKTSSSYLNVRNSDGSLSGSWQVPKDGSALTIYLYAGLSVYAEGGAVADYSHTGRFSWVVPEGVTITSTSGRFMAAAPVPEPSSAALLLAGLALLPVLRRRR